ncbi:MAG: hypothetical protein PWQ37_2778 [Candidatus Petromonas sp.]|jgi:hypothetical protein|nr:hypothetical protein [Candidatus Petromonas sp.]
MKVLTEWEKQLIEIYSSDIENLRQEEKQLRKRLRHIKKEIMDTQKNIAQIYLAAGEVEQDAS